MFLETIFTPNFLTQAGAMGVFLYLTVKAIIKLYEDIRKDSKEREDKLMNYLDKKSETDKKVAETLDNVNNRLCAIEEAIREDESRNY
jgi:F0F1-type ATP synthase membrane subunit b/b'